MFPESWSYFIGQVGVSEINKASLSLQRLVKTSSYLHSLGSTVHIQDFASGLSGQLCGVSVSDF